MSIDLPAAPPPDLRFRRRFDPGTALRELWGAREFVRALVERDLRARYKQAFLGFGWAIVGPLVQVVVFTVFFKRVAQIDTGDVPYPIFAYLGLVPWQFFSASISGGGGSLLANTALLNKVYCPREVFPLASIVVAAVDASISVLAIGVFFVVTGFAPHASGAVWIPVLLAVQVVFTVGVTLIISSTIVFVRDIRYALGIILQLGLFATPVAYGLEQLPRSAWGVYSALNPLAAIIDGYRQAILYGRPPRLGLLALAAGTSLALLVGGYLLFKRLERDIADVA